MVSPGTVRRLCCDAAILPVVLGSHSEILDLVGSGGCSPAPPAVP